MDYSLNRPGWFPAARRFADALGHTSNFPMAYVHAVFLALSGHIVGRNSHIRYATALYPNSYVCLVGDSGIHHKSTAIALSLEALGTDLLADYPPIRSVTTTPGLLQAMDHCGGSALLTLDEIASMLAKGKQDFGSDLLASIVELYACPATKGTYTRHDPILVLNTFLTLIAASTVEWLQTSLTASDLMAGFGNRMTFVLGDPRPERSWPAAPVYKEINFAKLRDFNEVCRLSENARDVWNDAYQKFQARQRAASPFIRVLAERLPEKALKHCVVQAAWRNDPLVSDAMLRGALDWADYLYECLLRLVPSFSSTEAQVLAQVREGVSTRRKLYDKLGHVWSAEQIKRAIAALRWMGLVEEEGEHVVPLDKGPETGKVKSVTSQVRRKAGGK